jgi:hypothetical protein
MPQSRGFGEEILRPAVPGAGGGELGLIGFVFGGGWAGCFAVTAFYTKVYRDLRHCEIGFVWRE